MLILDPNDGRETGLRLERRPPLNLAEVEPPQCGFALDGAIREACDRVAEKVSDYALLAHALGLRLEWVGSTSTSVETTSDRWTWKMSVTYRLREAESA